MRASRGSAAFRSLCGDCGTFDARIGEGMGWNGIGWHVQSMFINDDQSSTMLISAGRRERESWDGVLVVPGLPIVIGGTGWNGMGWHELNFLQPSQT